MDDLTDVHRITVGKVSPCVCVCVDCGVHWHRRCMLSLTTPRVQQQYLRDSSLPVKVTPHQICVTCHGILLQFGWWRWKMCHAKSPRPYAYKQIYYSHHAFRFRTKFGQILKNYKDQQLSNYLVSKHTSYMSRIVLKKYSQNLINLKYFKKTHAAAQASNFKRFLSITTN